MKVDTQWLSVRALQAALAIPSVVGPGYRNRGDRMVDRGGHQVGEGVIRPLTIRALLVAVVLELLWAVLVGYEAHRVFSGPFVGRISMPWDVQILNFMRDWATPALAIIAVVWLADIGVSKLHRR